MRPRSSDSIEVQVEILLPLPPGVTCKNTAPQVTFKTRDDPQQTQTGAVLLRSWSVQIRAGRDDDRTFITEMARLACVIEDRPLSRPDAVEVIEMLPQASDAVLVATDDTGNPIGAAWWHFHQPPLMRATDGSPVPEMIVAVTEPERGHGVGTALTQALVAKAAGEFDQLALNVHIRNPAARLYSRAGFHVAGKGRGPLGVTMVRALPEES